jgi:hypothetical protein
LATPGEAKREGGRAEPKREIEVDCRKTYARTASAGFSKGEADKTVRGADVPVFMLDVTLIVYISQ